MKFFMSFAVIFCLAVCFASQSFALPADVVDEASIVDELDPGFNVEPETHGRHKRATCDLLSAFGVNDSACAAHCILLGKRGGYCNGKSVCVCRN